MSLEPHELRELARIMNEARDVSTRNGVMSLRCRSISATARAFELLAKQGREPQQIDTYRLTCATRIGR